MLKNLMPKVRLVFAVAQILFPYLLFVYLTLFLIEILLPGFVSNTLSLNGILVLTLIMGLLCTVGPELEVKEPQVGRKDYGLVAGLAILGGVIIFGKIEIAGILRYATALVSSSIIAATGVILLGKNEQIETEECPEKPRKKWRLLTYRVQVPLVYIFVFVIMTAFFLPQNLKQLIRGRETPIQPQSAETTREEPIASPYYWDDYNSAENLTVDQKMLVTVLNGGAEKGSAASASAILRKSGYSKVKVGDAKQRDYTGVIMMFGAQDKAQASIIKQSLSSLYPSIIEAPAETTEGGITLILGARE